MQPSRTSRMLMERERFSDERERHAASRGILTVQMLGQPTQLRIWSARNDSVISNSGIGRRVWFWLPSFSVLSWGSPAEQTGCNPGIVFSELFTGRLIKLDLDSHVKQSSVEGKHQTPSFNSPVPRSSSHMISWIISEDRRELGDTTSIGLCWSMKASSIPTSSDLPNPRVGGQARWLHRWSVTWAQPFKLTCVRWGQCARTPSIAAQPRLP